MSINVDLANDVQAKYEAYNALEEKKAYKEALNELKAAVEKGCLGEFSTDQKIEKKILQWQKGLEQCSEDKTNILPLVKNTEDKLEALRKTAQYQSYQEAKQAFKVSILQASKLNSSKVIQSVLTQCCKDNSKPVELTKKWVLKSQVSLDQLLTQEQKEQFGALYVELKEAIKAQDAQKFQSTLKEVSEFSKTLDPEVKEWVIDVFKDLSKEMTDNGKHLFEELKEKGKEFLESKAVQDLKEDAKKFVDESIEKTKEKTQELLNKLDIKIPEKKAPEKEE